jgi:hypothetical protein
MPQRSIEGCGMNWTGLLLVAFGFVWLFGSLFDWEWFWERGRQSWAAEFLGRDPARILYGLIGAAAIVLGVLLTFGVIGRAM